MRAEGGGTASFAQCDKLWAWADAKDAKASLVVTVNGELRAAQHIYGPRPELSFPDTLRIALDNL